MRLTKISAWKALFALFAVIAVVAVAQQQPEKTEPERASSGTAKPPPQAKEYPGAVTLTAPNGASASFVPGGAALQKLLVPSPSPPSSENGAKPKLTDIALGWDDPKRYESPSTNSPMFGVVVGRVINRIANASYELDGKKYKLAPNDDHGSALHGGAGPGWAHRKWDLVNSTSDSATYEYRSPDGDQKFPGALDATVNYLLKNDSLTVTMVVRADATNKEPTPVNIAQHSYFNLDGHAAGPRAIKNLLTTIDATHRAVLRSDGTALPTGDVEAVEGGPFDFHSPSKSPRPLGESWNATTDPEPGLGYEVMYLTANRTLAQAKAMTTKPSKFDKNSRSSKNGSNGKNPVGCSVTKDGSAIRAARFVSPCSGLSLEAWTSAPAFEIYTGNHLDPTGLIGKGGHEYAQGGGIALEAQDFTDFLHHADFPSCVLGPGEAMTRVFELRWGDARDEVAKKEKVKGSAQCSSSNNGVNGGESKAAEEKKAATINAEEAII